MAFKGALHLRGRSSHDVHKGALTTDQQASPPASPAASGTTTPSRSQSVTRSAGAAQVDCEPDLAGRQPKRSSSFGRGLGLSALAGLSKATDSVQLPAFTRRSGHASSASDGLRTPPVTSAQSNGFALPTSQALHTTFNAPAATAGNPDPGHIAQFSLRLSELVNKAFQPTPTTSPPTAGIGAAVGAVASANRGPPPAPPLPTITYDGRPLPVAARVQELAHVVTTELYYAVGIDDYLLRAVSRAALKALSLFVDRMDALLVSAAKDAGASIVPVNAKDGTQPPAAMEYNLGLVVLLWIVEDGLERCVEGDNRGGATHTLSFEPLPAFVAEILAPVRQRMERSILHIVNPLLANLRIGLIGSIAQAVPVPFDRRALHANVAAGSTMTPATALHPPTPAKSTSTSGSSWGKDFEGRVEGARRLLLPRLEARCGLDGEGWYVGLAVQIIWKGLLRLTARPMPSPASLVDPSCGLSIVEDGAKARNPTPAQLSSALKVVAGVTRSKKREDGATTSGRATPSAALEASAESPPLKATGSPPQVLKAFQEHTTGGVTSVTPSQTACVRASAMQAADFATFERCMQGYAQGFAPSGSKVKAHPLGAAHEKSQKSKTSERTIEDDEDAESDEDDSDADELARAALAEALHAIKSCAIVAAHLDAHPLAVLSVLRTARTGYRVESSSSGISTPQTPNGAATSAPIEVCRALKAIPPLLLLHLVYARMPPTSTFDVARSTEDGDAGPRVPSPPELFGLPWTDYSKALGGFASGETWATACASGWSEGIEQAWSACSLKASQLEVSLRLAQSEVAKAQVGHKAVSSPDAAAPLPSPGLLQEDVSAQQQILQHAQHPRVVDGPHASTASTPALSRQSSIAEHSESSVETPEIMTQSMSALDPRKDEAVHGESASDSVQTAQLGFPQLTSAISAPGAGPHSKGARWNLLKRSHLNKSSRDASGNVNGSSSPSPEQSPPFGPSGVGLAREGSLVPASPNPASDGSVVASGPAAQASARRGPFWRTSSTGHHASLQLGAHQPAENATASKGHAPSSFRIPGFSASSRAHSPRGRLEGAASPAALPSMTELQLEPVDNATAATEQKRGSANNIDPAVQKVYEHIARVKAEQAALQTELASLDLLARAAEFVTRSKTSPQAGSGSTHGANRGLLIQTPAIPEMRLGSALQGGAQLSGAQSASSTPLDPRLSKLRFAEQ